MLEKSNTYHNDAKEYSLRSCHTFYGCSSLGYTLDRLGWTGFFTLSKLYFWNDIENVVTTILSSPLAFIIIQFW